MRLYRFPFPMATMSILLVAVLTLRLPAQDEPSLDLAAMAEAAKSQFRVIPGDRVTRARASLEQATQRLSGFLATGTAKNAELWKAYLHWDEMSAELAKTEGVDVGKLGQIAARYYRDFSSLEHPRFAEMRAALLEYRTAIAMASDGQLAEKYTARLDELAQSLIQYEQQPTMELSQRIGLMAGWLESAGQAPELVAAIRARYWHPNLYAAVSQRMVSAGIASEITETSDVRDCILGTSIVGTAVMQGRTQAKLIDSDDNAAIQLLLTGNAHSDNVGYNRGVQIFSQGDTRIEATKSIYVDVDGISSDAAQACCSTDSTIDCIAARSGLIERVAWKRASRSKCTAEQIGSRHAEQQIASQVDQRAAELLQKARTDYQEKFRKPLLRRDEFPQDMKFRTAKGWLEVIWRQANATQLAAPNRPAPIVGNNDVAVQVHESFVGNFSRAMLGGTRLTGDKLVEILEENKLEVPEALKPSDDKEPWAITFASTDPVNATFSDSTIRFAIRGRQFELGDRVVKNTLEMSAVYQLEKTPTGAHLTRQGDVSVEYLGVRGQLPADLIIVRTVMRQKFEAMFAAEFTTTGVKLPGRWDKGGLLHLQQMASDGGWLNLAWIQADDAPDSPNAPEAPGEPAVAQAR